jgi:uncharacterized protein (DUF433 family)
VGDGLVTGALRGEAALVAQAGQRRHVPRMTKPLIISDPDILSGTPVFSGTRAPVKNLANYLEAGDNIDNFLDDFPSVSREQVIGFLEQARERLSTAAE